MAGSQKLNGSNQNSKRSRVGVQESLPIDIQCSNSEVEGYCKRFGKPEDINNNFRSGGQGSAAATSGLEQSGTSTA